VVRFIHTGDWQLGMTRHYLATESQALYTEARFEALRAIGRIARERHCEFVVCCGDVFEFNEVDARTVARACDALATISVPVWLLPGNHDPLNSAAVFRSRTFLARKPDNVRVIEDETPIALKPGVELVGAPWTSKRPLVDLVARALAPLGAPQAGVRIAVAHGCVDTLSPDGDNPAQISLAAAESAIAAGKLHYLALGDRHSLTDVGASGRVRYAGTPEATDYGERAPGHVLVVELDAHDVKVEAVRTGTWHFRREKVQLTGAADLALLRELLAGFEDKGRCIAKLDLEGTLTLSQKADLDGILELARLTLGALEVSESGSDLKVVPDAVDFAGLGLSGFAERAVERLREQASGTGPDALTARDALGLLLRLTKEAS